MPSSPSPGDGATLEPVNTNVTFYMYLPTGLPLKYDLYWGTDPTPPLLALNVPISGAYATYPLGAQAYSTTYHWRVVIHDAYGNETSGPTWNYTTRPFNTPPYVPTMQAPPNGAIKLPINVTLDYSMYDFDGPVANADVYLGTDQNPPLFADHVSTDKYTPPPLAPNKAYYWRVVARDAGGLTTSGPTWTFSTANTTNQSPAPPTIYWSDGSLPSPTLYWNDGSDPDGEALTYDIYFATGTDNNHPYQLITSTTAHSIQVGPLDDHHRYYWRVKVKDSVWTVNGPEQWFDYGSVPVLFSLFEAHEQGTAVQVNWRLHSDEAMDSYTLYRREGTSAVPIAITNAPVSGINGSYLDTSVQAGKTYRYELLVRTNGGDEFRSPVATVSTAALHLVLHQNVPNPFNPLTTIGYDLPADARVRLDIVDVSGRRVRTVVDETQTAGSRSVIWNGRDHNGAAVSSGVYFYVLEAGKQRLTKKLVLLK